MMNLAQLARTDINLLVLFEVAYQERHLGRAAQRLGLTASAISHGLNRLRRLRIPGPAKARQRGEQA